MLSGKLYTSQEELEDDSKNPVVFLDIQIGDN